MIDRMNWKGLERSGHHLIEVLFWHLPRGSGETQEKTSVRIAGVLAEIRTEHLPNQNLDHLPPDQLI
jgi:hypothetical protein